MPFSFAYFEQGTKKNLKYYCHSPSPHKSRHTIGVVVSLYQIKRVQIEVDFVGFQFYGWGAVF